jgi:DNA (cytosine-5)-methyltransferase 1
MKMGKKKGKKFTFIDLFAGCGGLSEGFYRCGFKALAHVEINKFACETLRNRMRYYGYARPDEEVIEHDITASDIITLIDRAVAGREVDIIIGGPPCQAYSTAGRARDPEGMKKDPRNFLFENYVKILNHYKPKFFVFENVTGILSASIKNKRIIKQIFAALGKYYNLVDSLDCVVLNSVNYGVPQQRKRVIIFGVRKDISISIQDLYNGVQKTHYGPDDDSGLKSKLKQYVSVRDAIAELPPIRQGEGQRTIPFQYSLGNDFLKRIGSKSLHELYDHVCRKHNALDVERYSEMSRHHWTFTELLENRPDLHHEHARLFDNSYVVQFWDQPARTIIAHLVKDGNQFIHPDPDQGRTITVREAARLQSFPDDFEFAGSRGEQFRQIGNAVPPLFAEALAHSMLQALKKVAK